jgi:hypothetical protein
MRVIYGFEQLHKTPKRGMVMTASIEQGLVIARIKQALEGQIRVANSRNAFILTSTALQPQQANKGRLGSRQGFIHGKKV